MKQEQKQRFHGRLPVQMLWPSRLYVTALMIGAQCS
nr:MAG TPA: hypothetical protein [Caudoviricetes sp.]